jgi:hypothetical protein
MSRWPGAGNRGQTVHDRESQATAYPTCPAQGKGRQNTESVRGPVAIDPACGRFQLAFDLLTIGCTVRKETSIPHIAHLMPASARKP